MILKTQQLPERVDDFYYNWTTNGSHILQLFNLNDIRPKRLKTWFGIQNPEYIFLLTAGPNFKHYLLEYVILTFSRTRYSHIQPAYRYIAPKDKGFQKKSEFIKKFNQQDRYVCSDRGAITNGTWPISSYLNSPDLRLVRFNIRSFVPFEKLSPNNKKNLYQNIMDKFITTPYSGNPIRPRKIKFQEQVDFSYSKEVYEFFHKDKSLTIDHLEEEKTIIPEKPVVKVKRRTVEDLLVDLIDI